MVAIRTFSSDDYRTKEDVNYSPLPTKKTLLEQIRAIPYQGTAIVREPFYVSSVINILNLISQISALANEHEAFPILSLFLLPFSFYHACANAKDRIELLINSLRVYQFSNAFFFGAQAFDGFCHILGLLAKGANGTLNLTAVKIFFEKGLKHTFSAKAFFKAFGITVTFIIPIVLIVSGAVGTIATAQSLWKNIKAYRNLDTKLVKEDDLEAIFDNLKYFRGPLDVKDSPKSKVDREIFESTHSINEGHFNTMQKRVSETIDGISNAKQLFEEFELKRLEISSVLNEASENLWEAYDSLVADKGNYEEQVDALLIAFNKLQTTLSELDSELGENLNKLINDQIETLKQIKGALSNARLEGKELIDQIKAEMRRNILICIVNLAVSLVTIVAGVLALTHSHWMLCATIIGTTTGIIEFSILALNKTIPMDKWRSIELALLKLHKRPPLQLE